MSKILYGDIASVLRIDDQGLSSCEDNPSSEIVRTDSLPEELLYISKLALYIDKLVYLFYEFNYLLANDYVSTLYLLSLRKDLVRLGEEVDKSSSSSLNERAMSCITDKLKDLDERVDLSNLIKNLELFGKENLIMSQVAKSITKYVAESQSNPSVRDILFSFVKLKCFVPIFEYTKENMKLLKSDITLYEQRDAEIEYYIDFCNLAFPGETNIDKLIALEYVNASSGYELEQVATAPYRSLNDTLIEIDRSLIGLDFESVVDQINYIKQLNLTHF